MTNQTSQNNELSIFKNKVTELFGHTNCLELLSFDADAKAAGMTCEYDFTVRDKQAVLSIFKESATTVNSVFTITLEEKDGVFIFTFENDTDDAVSCAASDPKEKIVLFEKFMNTSKTGLHWERGGGYGEDEKFCSQAPVLLEIKHKVTDLHGNVGVICSAFEREDKQ